MNTEPTNTTNSNLPKQSISSSEPLKPPKFSSYVDYILEKINPSFQIINDQYSKALNTLNKQRISKLLDTPALQFANLEQKQVSFINYLRKNINSLHLVYSGIDTQIQELNEQPQSRQELISSKQVELNSESNLHLHNLIKSINESCQSQIALGASSKQPLIQYPDIENQYMRAIIDIHQPSNIKIKDRTYQKMPLQVDYSQITQMALGGLGMDLCKILTKCFFNLTKLHIKMFSDNYGPHLFVSVPIVVNAQSNGCISSDLKIIHQLANLRHLQQLRVDIWTTLYIDQYPIVWGLFPKIKTLFFNSQFIQSTVLLDVFRKNRNIQSIVFSNTVQNYTATIITHQILVFLSKAIPNLKKFLSSKSKLQQNYHPHIGKLLNLQQLCIWEDNIEQELPRAGTGYGHFAQFDAYSKQNENKNQKNFESLIMNLKSIRKLHYTATGLSFKSLELLHQKLPNIQDLQLKTNSTLDLRFFDILSKFYHLKKLYLTISQINTEGWEILAKAKFQLKIFHLASIPTTKYYTTYNRVADLKQEEDVSFSAISSKFFKNQTKMQQLKIKQEGNNKFFYSIHQLNKLKNIQIELQTLLTPSTDITEAAFVYLSKLREVQSFTASENQYQNPLISQSFFRFIRNNNKITLKPVSNSKLSYKVQRNMYLLNKGANSPQYPTRSYYNSYNNYYNAGSYNFGGNALARNTMVL